MANYNVTLTVQAGKGSSATFSAVNGSGLTSGNPLDLQIGDTVTFIRSGVGGSSFSGLSIFTNNADFSISHGGSNVVRTVASGTGTTADSITGANQAANATDIFYFERQGLSPSYSLATVNNMNEGTSQTVTVNTSNVANGTLLYFTISPASQDFNSTSGAFTINSNTGSFTISTLSDSTTEGSETKTLYIRTGSASGTVVASQSFTVFDTSQTPAATYSLSVGNMNEGVSQSVSVTTTNFGSGTLYWTIANASGPASTADFSAASGSVSISGNSGSFTITSTADSTTEGGEVHVLTLRSGSTSGTALDIETFTVFDTSQTPPAATHSLGTVSNMNEGATQTISTTSTNFGSGTLYWSIDGNTDFTAYSGSFSVSNNSGSFSITSISDQTTEGNETKYVRLRTGSSSGTIQDTAAFTLVDTSTASGGSGSGGTSTGGSTTGTANYGVAVYGPNGTSVVFGSNLRTQNTVFSTTLSAASGTTYGPYTVADANNTNKIQILVDYNVPANSSDTVSGSQIHLTKSSTNFTFRHTAGGTKSFVITAIKIA